MKFFYLLLHKFGKKKLIAIAVSLAFTIAAGITVPIVVIQNSSEEHVCQHSYDNACDTSCNVCGEFRAVDAHVYLDATCTAPKSCQHCGVTDGEPNGHTWADADCDTPKTCQVCGVIEGLATGHTPMTDDGDCTTPVTCTACGHVVIEAKAHDYGGTAWQKDEQGHWHACKNDDCQIIDGKNSHREGSDGLCVDCGYLLTVIEPHVCDYIGKDADETHHWLKCTCGAEKPDSREEHRADDDGDCTTAVICSCGYTLKAAQSHIAGADDGNCTTPIPCIHCEKNAVAGADSHIEGTDGTCTVCGTVVTPPHEHVWGTVTYEWNTDHTACVATRACTLDASHQETENGTVTSEVTKPATCAEKGETTYTATFANAIFVKQTKTVENLSINENHAWGTVTYEWNTDYTACVATRVCTLDASHQETESGTVTSEVTKPATCAEKGETTYTATFANAAFTTQTKTVEDVPIDASLHHYEEPTIEWNADYSDCEVQRHCTTGDHTDPLTETVKNESDGAKTVIAYNEQGSDVAMWVYKPKTSGDGYYLYQRELETTGGIEVKTYDEDGNVQSERFRFVFEGYAPDSDDSEFGY